MALYNIAARSRLLPCLIAVLREGLNELRAKVSSSIIVIILLTLFFPLSVAAQLCNGSLGDPIVNIDFGRGSTSRGAPLAAGITNYRYSGSNVDDGFYTIVNNTSGMNQNWFVTNDHTPGDNDGYMMLVNASYDPGTFYRVSITGLCPGTKYEAAAWIMNLLTGYDGKKPDITFWVETAAGDLIGQPYTTGEISQSNTPQWLQYGFFFTTPANTSEVVLNIRNNGPGGAGNDLVLDDITFRPCGPDVVVSATLGNSSMNFCEGDDVNLELVASVSGDFLNPLTQWQRYDGAVWQDITGGLTNLQVSFTDASPGNYLYRLAVGEPATFGSERCRINSNVFTITVNPKPVPAAGNNGPVCYGRDLVLTAQGGGTYAWTGPNGFVSSEQSPVIRNVTVAAAGVYQVTVTSAAGCIQTDQTRVEVIPPPVANAGDDVAICIGGSTALHAKGGTSYKWIPSVGLSDANSPDPIATPLQTTAYTVSVSNGSCTVSDEVLVTVLQPAIAYAGSDKVIIEGDSVMLEGKVTGSPGLRYYWTPSDYLDDPTSLHPKASPPSDMIYTLHAESNTQCTSTTTDEVFVKVFKKLIIPNTFSPNGDGVNDVWNIETLAFYPQSDIKVYNRYGTLIFSETGYSKPWDGKLNGQDLPPGVYYYIISPKPRLKPEVYRGWVIIAK